MPTTQTARAAEDAVAVAEGLFQILPSIGRISGRAAQRCGLGSHERSRLLLGLRAGPLRAGVLAQRCKLSAPAVTELVEALVDDGLARRDADPDDRRGVVVALTADGRRQLQRFEHAVAAELAEVLERLSAAQRVRLRAALADLRTAFAASGDDREAADAR